ncbi:MAG: hypothetical protein V1742_02515 [Pseudomonadota bacterium]
MAGQETLPEWLWVVVETSNKEETLLALEEEQEGVKIIPAFKSQEDGQACLKNIKVPAGAKHELQAIRRTLLVQAAQREQVEVAILDGAGRIIQRLPHGLKA